MIKVFVYGTLKPQEINYANYCLGKVIEEIRASTQGMLFNLPLGYPAMIEGNGKVEGFVLSFTDPQILELLDRLEDYQPERSLHENEYYRQLVEVHDRTGNSLGKVWSYFMTSERVKKLQGVIIPSGWWIGR